MVTKNIYYSVLLRSNARVSISSLSGLRHIVPELLQQVFYKIMCSLLFISGEDR